MNAKQRRIARRLAHRLIRGAVPVRFRKWWGDGFAYGVLQPVQHQVQFVRLPQVRVLVAGAPAGGCWVSLWNMQAYAAPLKRTRGVATDQPENRLG